MYSFNGEILKGTTRSLTNYSLNEFKILVAHSLKKKCLKTNRLSGVMHGQNVK